MRHVRDRTPSVGIGHNLTASDVNVFLVSII